MCPICWEDLNDDNYQVICWNSHQLCRGCYQRHKRSRGAKCPECRGTLIDWDVEVVAVVVRRARRCGICRQEGHDRRRCAQIQQNAVQIEAQRVPIAVRNARIEAGNRARLARVRAHNAEVAEILRRNLALRIAGDQADLERRLADQNARIARMIAQYGDGA
jgi:hypothetical protein